MADDTDLLQIENDAPAPADAAPVEKSLDDIISEALDANPEFSPNRDEQGRFAPKAEDDETPTDAKQAKAEQSPVDQQGLSAPEDWSEADKAKFATWTRDVQEAVVERHKAWVAEKTRVSQETAELRKQAEPFLQAVGVHQDYLNQVARQTGIPPGQLILGLLNAERTLRTGTIEQKLQAAQQVFSQYGIDLSQYVNGGSQGQPQPQPGPQYDPYKDPRFAPIISDYEERQANALKSTVESFKDAKDASGAPKYPYFQHVQTLMGHKMLHDGVKTMEEAYEIAVAPIKAALAAAKPASPQQTEQEKAAALAKARKAAPVKASGTTPKGTVTGKDLDSIISAALDAHGF